MSKNPSKPVVAFGLSVSLAVLSLSGATMSDPTTQPTLDRTQVAQSIASAATTGDVASLADAKQALAGTFSGERLATALAETDAAKRTAALASLAEDLTFEPTSEAPTPEGWPAFTPIGEIELKSYPAYRTAFTKGSTFVPDSVMFWKLFLHIQRNKISMTAPVEMTLDDAKKQNTTAMAFMYQSDEIGKLGDDVNVTVVDVPAQLAVSVGLRGEMDKPAIAEAAKRIDQWLATRAGEYEPAGELRVLGYNSPSMPAEEKFYEVQRVVTKKDAGK